MLTSSGPRPRPSLARRERAQNLSLLLSAHPPSHSIGRRSSHFPRQEIRVMDCCAHEGGGRGDARFEIKKVADGVHVAVAAPAYKVNSNTAIIESDDGVVIVDTHSKPSAARVIVERLRDITTKPVRYVVNTHFHWDHWHGNEVYPAASPSSGPISRRPASLRSAPGSRPACAWPSRTLPRSRHSSLRCRRSPSSRR